MGQSHSAENSTANRSRRHRNAGELLRFRSSSQNSDSSRQLVTPASPHEEEGQVPTSPVASERASPTRASPECRQMPPPPIGSRKGRRRRPDPPQLFDVSSSDLTASQSNVVLYGDEFLNNNDNNNFETDEMYRRNSVCSSEMGSTVSDLEQENDDFSPDDFYPKPSRDFEWMGRSIESLILGQTARAPMLLLLEDDEEEPDDFQALRRRSTASTFGGCRRRSSAGSFPGGRRGSLSLSGGNIHGGTLANYYNRRRQAPTDVDRSYERQGRRGSTSHTTPMYRRRSSMAGTVGLGGVVSNSIDSNDHISGKGGPNVVLSLMARENTGQSCYARGIPNSQCLRSMGGHSLFLALDKPASGIATEVAFLAATIDTGDWAESQAIISRLAPRLIGDPMASVQLRDRSTGISDPSLPSTAPRFYAGGGRTGLERDAFVQAGGVEVLIRVFREKSFVGQEMAYSYDARDLSPEIVATRLAPCWNEALACLRELVFSIPSLVDDRKISDNGGFLPFLFSLLSHDSCFDGAAALIEEVLALLSQSPQQLSQELVNVTESPAYQPVGRSSPPTTFFLGNVPDLYKLWDGFNCRQLAHFCRILALLVFEPEDRQLLESPAVLKSLELLQLRRNRAVRASRDSTVDMNQSILLGDEKLLTRLLKLLRVMNYAPGLRRIIPYHVMAQFPFVADTLVMLGLGEIESWSEIDRLERLARKLLVKGSPAGDDDSVTACEPLLSELGNVAEMLEGLSEILSEPSNQIGHIIHVISAAQQAGVIVGRGGRGRRENRNAQHLSPSPTVEDQESAAAALRLGGVPVDSATIQGLASVAGILTDQVLVRRLYQSASGELDRLGEADGDDDESPRHFISTPEDAANSLQFNAILLGSYHVEVLFVLCTLLGGRRKLDVQCILERRGLVPILDDMFQRLPWYKVGLYASVGDSPVSRSAEDQSNGIHGPGCDCTPESALCVQYLRLLHNFCDRDCDNYTGRRLLLSPSERRLIFDGTTEYSDDLSPGLLTKIIGAFVSESDESPYRFWLASCIESYLRGSSPEEQLFVAQSGLMAHLVDDISSDRLHCAGSLQTSFDLLGELGKGNPDVLRLLVHDLDEHSFRKMMSVAAANLVDSNVFLRSLLLTVERLSAEDRLLPLYVDQQQTGPGASWKSEAGSSCRSYLTHSWWDTPSKPAVNHQNEENFTMEELRDDGRPSDWFPPQHVMDSLSDEACEAAILPSGLEESVGHFGWVFTPGGDYLSANAHLPNTVERLSWFLAANQARLLRDLLGVVDLRNINHENICCLNTAVVVTIFAHRRRQLPVLLQALRQMNDEERESKRRAAGAIIGRPDDVVDRAFAQAMRYLSHENGLRETPHYARIGSITGSSSLSASPSQQQIGDRADVMRNFREVLWFWNEYYTHRGRDRLSLEFSSHLRFHEWHHVVSLLSADDGSPTALVRNPVRLPRSPYQRAARIADNPVRGV